ncbi:MAG TPA: hypothetical protein VI731_00985, partial [Bacteroidia bacterium]|nr:hypothetical protein [Bacteroidia bacterium]
MKNVLLTLLVISCTALQAQIPNSSFETWIPVGSWVDPSNWETTNSNNQGIDNVVQTTPAHSGSTAMRLEAWTYMTNTYSSNAVCPYSGGV